MTFTDLFHNHLLMSACASWLAAQVIKTVIYAIMNKSLDWHRLLGDGGMPSGHSATVTSLATATALEYGLGSPLFAIAAIFAIVVMHDATGVRRETGKQAQALNELLRHMEQDVEIDVKLKELVGHTPLQVFFGAILGLVMALLLR